MKQMHKKNGFTIIELLIVVVLVAMVFSVALPISYGMYATYNASLRAQEVMAYVSALRRDAFLYGERKVISSQDGMIAVGGEKKPFDGVRILVSSPIVFFRNGTSTGGTIVVQAGDVVHRIVVKAPLGDFFLEIG